MVPVRWQRPACPRPRGNRGIEVELEAPTASHQFELRDVAAAGDRADVVLVYRLPTADFVAQVVTPHRVEVPAARLGDARAVWIRIATGDGDPRLAIVTARP